jgi:GT2 family glycosyltransferase
VIIPSYNSRDTIRACLESVLRQETELSFEVLVADSSDDGTDEVIRSGFPEVRLIHSPERLTCGAARNAAIRIARGEFLLLVDADCEVGPDWMSRMVGAMRDLDADGICGSVMNGTPWSVTGSTGYFLEFFRFLGPRGRARPIPFLLGGTSGYRRSAFDGAGFADSNAGDDFEFSWRLWKRGARLLVVPSIAVVHHNRTGFRRVLRYQYSLGRAAGRYRCTTNPRVVQLLRAFPPVVLALPPLVLLWIGAYVLTRCRPGEVCRFLAVSPLLLCASCVWAGGLMRELATQAASAAPGPRVGSVRPG